jgi:hypothetical protein
VLVRWKCGRRLCWWKNTASSPCIAYVFGKYILQECISIPLVGDFLIVSAGQMKSNGGQCDKECKGDGLTRYKKE